MKRIRIASGIKRFEDGDMNATLFRLRDILNEHRTVLISRLVSDLGTYIDYKFKTKATARQLDSVRESLHALKNSVLDLERYNDIVDHCFQNELTHVGTEPFMQEIDENISNVLNISQLKLVN